MGVIAVIEEQNVVRKILDHLGIWEVKPRPPPPIPKAQPRYTGPYVDYSHWDVGPYRPDADCQVATFG